METELAEAVTATAYLHTPSDPDAEPYWVIQVDVEQENDEVPMRVYINDGCVYAQVVGKP